MEIFLSESQQMLKNSAREFLQRECPKELVRAMEKDERGNPPELWRKLAELGWLGWSFPIENGGSGGDFFDLSLLVEELGFAATPTPFFSSVVMGGLLLLEAGSEEQKHALLPRIAAGDALLSLAYLEESEEFDNLSLRTSARVIDDGFVLQGSKRFVYDAHVADHLVCLAKTQDDSKESGGLSLFIVDRRDPSIRLRQMVTTAGDKQFEVSFDDVKVGKDGLVGSVGEGSEALERLLLQATALKCAEMVGGAQAVLDLTVEYAKWRVQFGRPIGGFQAVQHHCVDMYRDLEVSRMLTYQACWYLSQNMPADRAVSAAKLKLNRVYPAMTRMAHQIVGGVGYYTEHPLELYTRRALAAAVSFGGPDYHARRLADTLWE